MVSPVSTPQPAASGRAASNAARVRQRWPFSGWAGRPPGGPPDARPGQADHEAVPAGPHPVGEHRDRHVRLAVPDRLHQRARAPGRLSQIAIEKEQVVALRMVVTLQQPDRLGAGLQRRTLAAAPGVAQHDRARALRHRRGTVP